ncbi:MAG: 2-C-methyl-D-erythritol 4-phosphate cytidylyltransferase [Candidatus Syntrophonatronum acetioxidans]|uniref:2-C-methyl-D-erythritol 4-phosphate cytidylyltransferase n=1 Tax=Candidatus Syntrophonatronum acetioxidans TaxID=1795816 RepID=A0A424Y9D9_9FIRM|nr:MAG: 2-C-methyl-D-erythritol 4-phosphate cytidylyltransferase [Candidatus Syntrophonatronum acetioxidans]
MGQEINKQYLNLAGKPLLAHTLSRLFQYPFRELIIVVAPGEEDYCREEVLIPYGFMDRARIVSGGKERQDSVYNALKILSAETEVVVVHDGARPLVSREIIANTVNSAYRYGAAIAAVPVKDTIKKVNREGFVVDTPPRETLWLVQTPQAFLFPLILEAYQKAGESGFKGTDDASLLEKEGRPVKIVKGSYNNIKVTTSDDLCVAEAFLEGE